MSAARRWVVTGASRGLGRALTEVVLDRGDRVVAAVRRRESMADLAQKYGSQIEVEQLDVGNLAAIDDVVGRVLARGPLDVVVNNAGFGVIGALEDQSPELVQSQLTTMLHAPIAITRAVLPALREHGGGHIFQISSMGGQMAFPGNTVYNAVKWGLEGFSESLAQDVAQFGIRVTIVEPGAIRTDFHHSASFPEGNPAYQEGAVAAVRGYFRTAGLDLYQGDPGKVAGAIHDLSTQENPPLRVPLCSDAFDALTATLQGRLDALAPLESLARSVAIDPAPEEA
ncbi:SDR family NAD(P)-dependent oxidoreductase [Amycolatopsis sp. CA-161197]|uniref:SDR family NAD(P)-dependent oxidoreductase n=1 Tax=Amycolatopsis sp. CA-161197 TaxID=3239922 RepID=UPI003D8A9F17